MMIMKHNIGTLDRILRLTAGVVLMTLAAVEIIGVWGYIGVVPLLTAVFGYCPVYALFGLQTCPLEVDENRPEHPPAGE